MDTTTPFEADERRKWLAFAGQLSVPLSVLPAGLWGIRAFMPRSLRQASSGALVLGVLSLVGWKVRQLLRPPLKVAVTHKRCSESARWKLPLHGAVMPEEFAASCASGR